MCEEVDEGEGEEDMVRGKRGMYCARSCYGDFDFVDTLFIEHMERGARNRWDEVLGAEGGPPNAVVARMRRRRQCWFSCLSEQADARVQ